MDMSFGKKEFAAGPMSHCRTPRLVTRIHCEPSSLFSFSCSLHDVGQLGHLAECCPSKFNAPLDLRNETPSLCLTTVHARRA